MEALFSRLCTVILLGLYWYCVVIFGRLIKSKCNSKYFLINGNKPLFVILDVHFNTSLLISF